MVEYAYVLRAVTKLSSPVNIILCSLLVRNANTMSFLKESIEKFSSHDSQSEGRKLNP